jgi:Patatin-like phospholipase
MSERPKTAFVLSGGAALGAIQVGMLRALYERGIEPDLIVGTSVGALNGAYIASRPFVEQTADELAEVWRGIGRGQVFPLNPVTGFLGFFGARRHLVPDGALRELLAEHLEFDRLEQAPVPFHVIATDVLSGRELRLSGGEAQRGADPAGPRGEQRPSGAARFGPSPHHSRRAGRARSGAGGADAQRPPGAALLGGFASVRQRSEDPLARRRRPS